MSLLTQDRITFVQQEVRSNSSSLLTVRLFMAVTRFAENHAWLVVVAISLVCGWGRLHALSSRQLDHDELFTYYISQAPTLRQLLELTRTVDLHPPLSYFLVRASFAFFGVSSWSCRVPFLLAFFLAGAVLFWLVRRILSPVYGFIAVWLLWSNPFAHAAEEARPYSLVVFFTALLLVSWYRAVDEENSGPARLPFVILAASGFGLLLSHVLSVFAYAAFLAAESIRFCIRRKSDWRLWAALLIPLSSSVFYLPLIHNRSMLLFAPEYAPTPLRMLAFYWESIRYVASPLTLILVLSALWPVTPRSNVAIVPLRRRAMSVPFGFLLFALSVIPVAIGIVFGRTGTAFFDRYGIEWLIPLSLVPPLLLGRGTSCDRTAGSLIVLVLAVFFLFNTSGKSWLIEQLAKLPAHAAAKLDYVFALPAVFVPNTPPIPPYLRAALATAPAISHLDAAEPELPIVAHTGLTFLELDHQENAQVTQRLYLLTDETAASNIAHDTVFAHYERLKEAFPIRGRVEPYCTFVSAHPRFLVVGAYNNPQGWLLRKLHREGAKLKVIGICPDNTEHCQIYEVEIGNAPCQQLTQ